ncbi:hypothetical protein [Humibacillus xanthopallidus]|uniref:Uncharacterized protein n=1 Tax=Humibacillus xanthopallidus TaxID=412689 RepID=A0A543HUG4_9MICO|nr:hypothetical protein [Humibacillus xanthopallidus]TQM61940.1 hypothetical protein FBY41_1962 [Humibacillus xanthopallidus]
MAVQLGSVALDHLSDVAVRDAVRLARYDVPAMAGDLLQPLGRPAVDLVLQGSFFGSDAAQQLAELRTVLRGGDPVDLLADAAGDGYVAKVVVAGLDVWQRSGDVERFDYRVVLVEYVEPPAAPALGALPGIDASLAQEAVGYLDDVQDAIWQISQLVSLTQLAGFGDPTTKAPRMLTDYQAAGGGQTEPASGLRDVLEGGVS